MKITVIIIATIGFISWFLAIQALGDLLRSLGL